MENIKNSVVLEQIIKALYTVTGRRTSSRFADKTIGAIIKSLEGSYDFLKYIRIDENSLSGKNINVDISSEIDFIDPKRIGRAIEAIIRLVYSDLDAEAGLYFISELKKYAGDEITSKIPSYDVDLSQLQMEQHLFFQRMNRKKYLSDDNDSSTGEKKAENPLGYTWNNVKSWEHEPGSKFCTLYDEKGNYDLALRHVIQGLNLFRKINNKRGIFNSNNLITDIYIQKGDIEEAKKSNDICMQIAESKQEEYLKAIATGNRGNVLLMDEGDIEQALEYYLKSLKIFENKNDEVNVASSYNNIAQIYAKKKDFLKAYEFIDRSLEIRKERRDSFDIAKTKVHLANIY